MKKWPQITPPHKIYLHIRFCNSHKIQPFVPARVAWLTPTSSGLPSSPSQLYISVPQLPEADVSMVGGHWSDESRTIPAACASPPARHASSKLCAINSFVCHDSSGRSCGGRAFQNKHSFTNLFLSDLEASACSVILSVHKKGTAYIFMNLVQISIN